MSVSTDLVVDARRDVEALGMLQYEAVKLHVSPVKPWSNLVPLRCIRLMEGAAVELTSAAAAAIHDP